VVLFNLLLVDPGLSSFLFIVPLEFFNLGHLQFMLAFHLVDFRLQDLVLLPLVCDLKVFVFLPKQCLCQLSLNVAHMLR